MEKFDFLPTDDKKLDWSLQGTNPAYIYFPKAHFNLLVIAFTILSDVEHYDGIKNDKERRI